MIKVLITATSFAVGGAGGVLVTYLSTHSLAFTHPLGEPPAVTAIRPVDAAPVAVEPPSRAIVLAEVRITGSPGKRAHPVMPIGIDTCADWNDVGAVFIEPAGATGVRQVRPLCAKPSNER
jgi:hypothetical protein